MSFPPSILTAVALGGALGALSRFLLAELVYHHLGRFFPYGTLAVNAVGSFLIGLLAVLLVERFEVAPFWRGLFIVGFLGAFTTFSTFALDAFYLAHRGEFLGLVLYLFLSIVLCLLAVSGGIALAHFPSWHETFPYGVLIAAFGATLVLPWLGLFLPDSEGRFLIITTAVALVLLVALTLSTWQAVESGWLCSWLRWTGLLFANVVAVLTAASVSLLLLHRYLKISS